VKISHGKGDLLKHGGTIKHQNCAKATIGQKSISNMFSSQRKGMDLEVKIKEAEIRMSVCPDSEIGKKNSVAEQNRNR
jgi:hypothetical protein